MGLYFPELNMPKNCKGIKLNIEFMCAKFEDGEEIHPIIGAEIYYCSKDVTQISVPHGRLIEEPKTISYQGLAYINPYDGRKIAEYFAGQFKRLPTIIEEER